jgi:4-hydroxy-tetrahydrodipicolinate reductase
MTDTSCRSTSMINVVQIGLGPIGLEVTRQLAKRDGFQISAAFDVDKGIVGKDLAELAGVASKGVTVRSGFQSWVPTAADVSVITTCSSLKKTEPLIIESLSKGMHVVSTCEELSYPWVTEPEISGRIDAKAKENGLNVLGTGINPGFLMDVFPITVTGICHEVRKLRVERIQNAAFRRLPFQKKIGAGLTLDEFSERVRLKTLRHVGLTESMHMIAKCLGWTLDSTEDVVEPVVADSQIVTKDLTIEPNQAAGVSQIGRGYVNDEEVITLVFRATVGEPEAFDCIQVEGTPSFDVKIDGGINGDIGTVAITINAIQTVLDAQGGLRTMADLPPISNYRFTSA